VVRSIIKAVENKREQKALQQETAARREKETQQIGVVDTGIAQNIEREEEEWETVQGVINQDIGHRGESPPSYQKAVKA